MGIKEKLRKIYPKYNLRHRIRILLFGLSFFCWILVVFLKESIIDKYGSLVFLLMTGYSLYELLMTSMYLIKFEEFINKDGTFKKAF